MRNKRRLLAFAAGIILPILLAGGCVSTPYGNKYYPNLTDAQLIEELKSIYRQLGIALSSIDILQATMPPPNLVVTAHSFTTFTATATGSENLLLISGSATTTTTWQAHDTNSLQRQLNQLARTIQQQQAQELTARLLRVEHEIVFRIDKRNSEAKSQVLNFFLDHPDMRSEGPLLVAVYPWVERESLRSTLDALAEEVERVVKARRSGQLAGAWYGRLDYRFRTPDGRGDPEQVPIRALVIQPEAPALRIEMSQGGGRIPGIDGMVQPDGRFVGTAGLRTNLHEGLPASGTITASEMRIQVRGMAENGDVEAFLQLNR